MSAPVCEEQRARAGGVAASSALLWMREPVFGDPLIAHGTEVGSSPSSERPGHQLRERAEANDAQENPHGVHRHVVCFCWSVTIRLYLDQSQRRCAIQDSEGTRCLATVPACQSGMAIALDSRRTESAGCSFGSVFERWPRDSKPIRRRLCEYLYRAAMRKWQSLSSIR